VADWFPDNEKFCLDSWQHDKEAGGVGGVNFDIEMIIM
jgi:hypothetical protein